MERGLSSPRIFVLFSVDTGLEILCEYPARLRRVITVTGKNHIEYRVVGGYAITRHGYASGTSLGGWGQPRSTFSALFSLGFSVTLLKFMA